MNITRYSHDDAELWTRIGRHFADRDVRTELGGPMSSDPSYSWYVADIGGVVAGFAACYPERGRVRLCHAYVLPGFRRAGAYRALLDARLRDAGPRRVRARATALSMPLLEQRGFRELRRVGKYFEMELRR